MNPKLLLATTLAMASIAACGHEPSSPVGTTTVTSYTPATLPPAAPVKPNSTIYLSERLRVACGIERFEGINQAPKFDFDQTALLPEDRAVLADVAKCVTTGPLAGRHIVLVGRADPRGAGDYNMALGEWRADSVYGFLAGAGVSPSQMKETSRGALDATGNDESTWRNDRRVDLDIRQMP
jgi:peptidoglycan-associated lipoprotein